MRTIFEKIINNEIEAFKIFEDKDFIAILDAYPKQNGHVLVIPKVKHENILLEKDDLISEMFVIAKQLSLDLMFKLEANSIKWIVNTGKGAGQVIPHTHLHLIPHYDNPSKQKKLTLEEVFTKINN